MKKFLTGLAALAFLASSAFWALPTRATSDNLLANPSMEQSSGGQPTAWTTDNWGTNKVSFNYLDNGHTGNHSLKTDISSYTSGDAKWVPDAVNVKPSTSYTYSDWFESNTASHVDLVVTTTTNRVKYLWEGDLSASSSWKQAEFTFTTPTDAAQVTIYHYIESVGQLITDDASLVDNTAAPTPQPTAPTVTLVSPSEGSTQSGDVTISADASDTQGVSSVQFKVDGTNIGAAVKSAPFTTTWDSTGVSNGSHKLTAVATNVSGLSAVSAAVSVNVDNQVTTPDPTPTPTPTDGTNLISNPSFETAADANTPQNWLASAWGNNSTSFSYLNTGHTGNRSVEVKTSSYSDGAANWYYNDVPVTAGTTYRYTDWYKSDVETEVDAEVVMNDGSVQYFWLGNVAPSSDWAQYAATFTVPAGAKSMAVYQILAKVGYIVSDDYSLSEYVPTPFNRGIVSVTFDDGWANQYANAYPTMQWLGLKGTYYIISGEVNDTPDYMSATQIRNLYKSGNEIGSHSITHPDMTTLSQTQLQREMSASKTSLENLIGGPVTNFAYPYGAYNSTTIAMGLKYYQSQRTVNGGFNTRDDLDLTQLKIHEVDSNISPAQVKAWIDSAAKDHTWLILVYHEVAYTPSAPDDNLYTTRPDDFTNEMSYLKSSDVSVLTMQEAVNSVLAQR